MAKARTKGTTGTKETASGRFIPPHGGYADLLSYQKALIVYDATVHFCNRYFSKFDRTREQMTQAARSGKQNILEGSEFSGTSKETEIKLTNTARASLKELVEDYRDFMRNRGLTEWAADHLTHCACASSIARRTQITPHSRKQLSIQIPQSVRMQLRA